MKLWLAAAALVLCLVPGFAGAQDQVMRDPTERERAGLANITAHPAECSRLRRQIDHFEMMEARAEQLKNVMWKERMEGQLEMLHGIQLARCPDDVPIDTAKEAFRQFMKLAAKAAITYFTFGGAGFMF